MDAAGGGWDVGLFSDNKTRTEITRKLVPPNPGTFDLRVAAVTAFNQKNLPKLPSQFTVDDETKPIRYVTIAADANLDDSVDPNAPPNYYTPTITANELVGLPPPTYVPGRVTLLQMVYRLLGEVRYTTLEPRTIAGITRLGVREHRYNAFQLNDIAVNLDSALGLPNTFQPQSFGGGVFERANHATLSGALTGLRVVEAIKEIER